jgi:hypothetical protein
MRLKREQDLLIITLNLTESRVISRVFRQLIANYSLKPGELDPKAAAAWYSTRGCLTAKMSPEETQEWMDHLHAFKSDNLNRLHEWSKALAQRNSHANLTIKLVDASAFMTAINDHRLMAAACHGITQREMEIYSPFEFATLRAGRRAALLEIHFLAWILEETLRALDEASPEQFNSSAD